MPFELIVQSAFTERLDGGGVRIRQAGAHITDPDQVEALRGRPHVVQVWVDEKPADPRGEPLKISDEERAALPKLGNGNGPAVVGQAKLSPDLSPAVAPSKT